MEPLGAEGKPNEEDGEPVNDEAEPEPGNDAEEPGADNGEEPGNEPEPGNEDEEPGNEREPGNGSYEGEPEPGNDDAEPGNEPEPGNGLDETLYMDDKKGKDSEPRNEGDLKDGTTERTESNAGDDECPKTLKKKKKMKRKKKGKEQSGDQREGLPESDSRPPSIFRSQSRMDVRLLRKQSIMNANDARTVKAQLFEFFAAENGLETKKELTQKEFQHVIDGLLKQLKMPKSPFVKPMFRKFAMGQVKEEFKAKMSLSVLKIVRECVPNAMTTVDFTQFKAIMEGLVAKVFSTLVDDGKKIVHAATAANLACLMRCGGYSSFVFEDAIRQLSHEWVERKPFCHFMLEEMLRFQCPFPSRYPVTRAIRFLALAIEDLSVARRAKRLTTKYLELTKHRYTGVKRDVPKSRNFAVFKELYQKLLDSTDGKQGRLRKAWFSEAIKRDPFRDLIEDGIVSSWHNHCTESGILDGNRFADFLQQFIAIAFNRMIKGAQMKNEKAKKKKKTKGQFLDHIAMDSIITLLTGTKETQTKQHINDYYGEEKIFSEARNEANIKTLSEGKGVKAASGLSLEQFGRFVARSWKHEADVGNPARAHARYLGTIFLLCFEDSTLIAIDQHRLESKQTLKDKKKPVISKSSAAQEQEKKEGDWRDFEYGLDLEFSDGGSDDDIESEDEEEIVIIRKKKKSKPHFKREPVKRKVKEKKKKKKRVYDWNERHWVLPSKNDGQVSKAYRSSFDVLVAHRVRADGSSELRPSYAYTKLPKVSQLLKNYQCKSYKHCKHRPKSQMQRAQTEGYLPKLCTRGRSKTEESFTAQPAMPTA